MRSRRLQRRCSRSAGSFEIDHDRAMIGSESARVLEHVDAPAPGSPGRSRRQEDVVDPAIRKYESWIESWHDRRSLGRQVAHSITLALATLGVVHVPGPPVEAVIALRILPSRSCTPSAGGRASRRGGRGSWPSASACAYSRTVTRRKVAGMEVASLFGLRFC